MEQEKHDVVVTRCALCGKKQEVIPVHKDYDKIRLNPKTVYVCDMCQNKLRYDADEHNKPKKPM